MIIKFNKELYTEDAIRKAYLEFLNSNIAKIKKTKDDFIIEVPDALQEEEVHHFENMVLLYTIEEKRK